MNLYLHGIGVDGDRSPIHVDDSLASDPGERFHMVLTNPPFGKKSSVTYVTDEGEIKRESQSVVRDDFWTSTSNKQLNFVQHVKTLLKVNGKAAVVVPDNVLFEGGAGEIVRRKLACLHLRPTGSPRQGQPRHFLAARREPGGQRQPARSRRAGGRDHGRLASGVDTVQSDSGGI